MNYKEAMTFDKYTKQKLDAEFGDAISVSSGGVLDSKNIKIYMKLLAESIGEGISRHGYKPSGKAKLMVKFPVFDPLACWATVGGKVGCKLTATKDQYVFYASEIIGELKEECKRQVEKTWKDRLFEHLNSLFYEEDPEIYDYEDRKLESKFIKKRDKLIAKIELLVEKFEIPQ